MTETILGPKSLVVGRLDGEILTIHGGFDGEIHATGRVRIAEEAHVKGTLRAAQVEIAGEFSGEVRCEHLVLLPSAKAEGRFHATRLRIDEGARVNGPFNDEPPAAAPASAPDSDPGITIRAAPVQELALAV
jgi:cytoskeletal protein CcmA (bactofilin family)